MTITPSGLRSAPLVSLVVAFAAVFAAGITLGRPETTSGTDGVETSTTIPAAPTTTAADPPGPENRVTEPDQYGNVDLGEIRQGTTFVPDVSYRPVVVAVNDELLVCLTAQSGVFDDYRKWLPDTIGLPRYCTSVSPGTSVRVRLGGGR